MKQAIAIGLLLLTLGCGRNRVEPRESRIHGDVIRIIPVATDARLTIIWTLTVDCVKRYGYVQSVPAPPNVVLVRGQIDCGGEQSVGCTEGTTTVWLTIDNAVFKHGTVIIAHEFINIILHGIGIAGEIHPAYRCETIVEKEL